MLNYISTRDGVDTDSCYTVNEDKLDRVSYVSYIAKRRGVDTGKNNHGLFGKIKDMKYMGDIYDLDDAIKYVRSKAMEKTTVYNAVISFDEQTALDKGITSKDEFAKIIKNNISSIAFKMGIPVQNIEYCASVHMEKSHPHVHLMYWNKNQKIGVNFIKPELSNQIRGIITKNVFGEELKEIQLQKDNTKRNFNIAVGELLSDSESVVHISTDKEVHKMMKYSDFKYRLIDKRGISEEAVKLFDKIAYLSEYMKIHYPVGGLKYNYLPNNVKEHLDSMVNDILNVTNIQLTKEYIKYLTLSQSQAEIYGGDDNVKKYIDGADNSLKKYIANQILDVVKTIKTSQRTNKSDEYKKRVVYNLFQNILNAIVDNQNHVNSYSDMSQLLHRNYKEMSQIDRDNLRRELSQADEYER